MPESVRLAALLACFIGILYIAYTTFGKPPTEQLDEPTIRIIYKQADALIKNPQGTIEFMQKRLNENYTRTGMMIRGERNKPDQPVPIAPQNKAQTLELTKQMMGVMSIEKYEHKIIDLKLSDNKQYAYVSSTETSSGKINLPLAANKKITVPFNSGNACIDTLTLEKAVITIIRSECTNKMVLLQ